MALTDPIPATFVSNTSFTIAGDCSEAFASGSRVLADCGSDGTRYGTVSSASYASSADLTTVTLSLDWGALTANLAGVLHGNDIPASLANHGHTGQADGGELPDFIRRDNSRTFSQGFISGEGAYTGFKFTETGADVATDTGKWIFQVDDGMFSMLAVDDAESAFHAALTINRDGAAPSAVTIAAPYVGLSADNVEAAGNLVPAASDPGSLGSATRPWADVRTDKLLSVDVSNGTVDALVSKATAAVAVAGTDTSRAMTAAATRQAVLSWARDNAGKFPGVIPPGLNLFCGDATNDTAPAGTFTRSTTATRRGQSGLIETVAAGGVRREWGQDGTLRGWRLEAQATNLLTYSQALDDSSWVKVLASLTANAAIAPDGTMRAGKIIPNETYSSSHSVYHAVATEIGMTYTFSTFAKPDEYKYIGISLYDISSQLTIFDLTNALVVSGAGSIEYFGDGWYRCSVHFKATKTTCYGRIYIFPTASISGYSGDNVSGVYLWGGQIEAGTYPTSYIPTTDAAVARAADVWTIPLDASWFRETAGTLFVAGRTAGIGTQNLLRLDNGTSANTLYLYRHGTSRALVARAFANSEDVLSATMDELADYTAVRIALAWSDDGYWVALNGAIVASGLIPALPSVLTDMRIGASVSSSAQWGGHIRHVAYFPTALPAAQLQALTL